MGIFFVRGICKYLFIFERLNSVASIYPNLGLYAKVCFAYKQVIGYACPRKRKKVMKKTILLFTFLYISNLYSQKNTIIPYVLDINSENSIYQYIKEKKQDSIAFYFERLENDKIKIHLSQKSRRSADSNRKLLINDKLYSIIFDLDYIFYVKSKDDFPIVTKFKDDREREFDIVKMPNIEERMKNKSLYAKDQIKSIIDWSIFWIVDQNGKLVETNSK